MADIYLWLKAVHILAVVAWMAGMLYLPRLYVYHHATAPKSEASETFKVMELRLLRAIINPAMIATWVLGLTLIWVGGGSTLEGAKSWFISMHWLHAKLALVLLMQGIHGGLSKWRKQFERDERPHSAKFFRIINEVPMLLLIGIVILVVVKPF